MNRLQMPMMTKQRVKTSFVVIAQTPFLCTGAKEIFPRGMAPFAGDQPPTVYGRTTILIITHDSTESKEFIVEDVDTSRTLQEIQNRKGKFTRTGRTITTKLHLCYSKSIVGLNKNFQYCTQCFKFSGETPASTT